MPTNNFKLFDEKKANMMTDEDYAINQQRLNGVQSGVASSQLQNKTLYQTALMCYALAQLMAANGYDANDANAVSTFVNNLSLSMVQKVVDKASAADLDAKTVGKWVDANQLGNYLKLSGGSLTGDLILNGDPTDLLQAATKQYVDNRAFLLYSGLYVADGTYGSDNPTSITFPFAPIIITNPTFAGSSIGPAFLNTNILTTSYQSIRWFGSSNISIKKSEDGKTISWYSNNENNQANANGNIYEFIGIAGTDLGSGGIPIGQEFKFISSSSLGGQSEGMWKVPATGRYYLEMYGGGGSPSVTINVSSNYQGGSSCQSYDSINLTEGQIITMKIANISMGGGGRGTTFGNYSVDGGWASTISAGGTGSGNKGKDGTYQAVLGTKNYPDGVLGKQCGWGINGEYKTAGGPGGVYLKYLGE